MRYAEENHDASENPADIFSLLPRLAELTLHRREICSEDTETLYVLNALGAFQDPKARELLDTIYARWKSFDGEGGSILQACEYVLQEPAKEKDAQKN
ncbi:MAG TPA: hypothetical protein PLQ35_16010 [bacterium]|nr:hypothetical protein [bacterium]HQL63785.1 hypothetical protein [bacterium]